MKDVILLRCENITKEGLTLIFNKPTKLKGIKGFKTKELWVSWDCIGEMMFEGYTNKVSIEERNKLRK